jgi:hypothetical protein
MDGRPSSGPVSGRDGSAPNGRERAGRRPLPDRGRSDPRTPGPDELPVHPLHTGPGDPPPPAREQLPLPRRRQQAHIAPQLLNPDEADTDTGTPFAAFSATRPGPPPAADRDLPTEFQNGSRRARRNTRNRGRRSE